MVFNDLLTELRLIRIALEKLADIKSAPKELPSNSKFEFLSVEEDPEGKLYEQLEEGKNAGFMFEEDAVDLELLDKI